MKMSSKVSLEFLTTDQNILFKKIKKLFSWADTVRVFVSYASYRSFAKFEDQIYYFLRKGGRLQALFDIERHITDPEIIEELNTIPGDSECRIYIRDSIPKKGERNFGPYHSKLYIFQSKDKVKIIIGSSNFTLGGLLNNIESNVLIGSDNKDPIFNKIESFYNFLWDSPQSIPPDAQNDLLEKYREYVIKERKRARSLAKDEAKRFKTLMALHKKAQNRLLRKINSESAYLLGLIAGGGRESSNDEIIIRYKKGTYNKGTKDEGFIYARGISRLKFKQDVAIQKDVYGIVARLKSLFNRSNSGDTVSVRKRSDYTYDIVIKFVKKSKYLFLVNKFVDSCLISRKKIIPQSINLIAKSNDDSIIISFIRGYGDVRARIRPTDRAGTAGSLRIALSFSKEADIFAENIRNMLIRRFSFKKEHINLLRGERRDRETMLRIDPVDIYRLIPFKFFSVNWKQLLLKDFSDYNQKNFSSRY